MKKLEYRVSFTTPAFLGNAEQQAQWRTPPFKALIRQWWRVAVAKSHGFDHRAMREAEGDFFGNAWLRNGEDRSNHRKSRIMLRLDHWAPGETTSQAWPGGPMESITTTADGKGTVRSDVYLGFGPVLPPSKKENRPSITIRNAIGPDQSAVLRFFPNESDELRRTLQLMAWFGTLGSRSRNGWGSLSMTPMNGAPTLTALPDANDDLLKSIRQEWEECFARDWAHALGIQDGKPLIWLSQSFKDWRKAMGCLAQVRVEVRRVAKRFTGPGRIGGIHLLGYPAGGKWELPEFKKGRPNQNDQEGRLATQLHFKVCATPDGLVGMVFHLPHCFPRVLCNRLGQQQKSWLNHNERKVWQAIHASLDGMARLKRVGDAK